MKIAIIGLSFKLPNNINNLNDLEDILSKKIDCVTNHPKDRFNLDRYYDKENNVGKMRTKRAAYTKNIYDFDAEFFKISPKEAKSMDPQQRIMLELIYECILDSTIPLKNIKGSKTGVFVGSCSMEYFNMESEQPEYCNEYSITGGLLTLLSNRISYNFNLKGPSLTMDTACSSSGHALHLACQSLINGESDMCFVGGSNILISPETFVGFSQATMLSPDGKCKSFDAAANGYVRGEGFVSLLIKPLDKAIEDNNKIYAVINKTGINQDGKTPSITMPNPDAQMALLKELYQDINLEDLLYVEAHGTGTVVGDYNETLAIGNVLGVNKKDKLNIGSIKSNIGHLEASSGLASIVKLCLMLSKKKLLPNIHFNTPSPKIDFTGLNLNVVTDEIPIEQETVYMGINNFGFGGSNFHCILENYNDFEHTVEESNNQFHLLAIHGVNSESIDRNILSWTDYSEDDFMKYVYNQNKKDSLAQTKIFVLENKDDFEEIIYDNDRKSDILHTEMNKEEKLDIAFVFCGQGAQHIDMGYDMCEAYSVFKDTILRCDKIWKDLTQESFVEKNKLFLPEFKELDKKDVPINDPIVAQPAIFFYQVALVELYKSFNIKPSMIIGHSAGEQCAFYASGALTLEETIKISYYRSILQQKTAGTGNMLVIAKSETDLQSLMIKSEHYQLYKELELACQNDSNSIVLAGPSDKIKKLNKYLSDQKIFNVIIRGNCPFHSSLQEIVREDILEATKDLNFIDPEIELISTALGEPIDTDNYTPDYWWKNIRQKVSFVQGMRHMDSIDLFVEIGPHPVLGTNIKNIYNDVDILTSSNRKENSAKVFMKTIANLWSAGHQINLDNFGVPNNKMIPKYAWNHKTYKNEPRSSHYRRNGLYPELNIIEFEVEEYSYISDHIINNNFVFPTVGYLDLIIRYFRQDNNHVILNNFEILNMYVPQNKEVKLKFNKVEDKLEFLSIDEKVKYLSTNIMSNNITSFETNLKRAEFEDIVDKENYDYKISGKECYNMFKSKNVQFGKNMMSIKTAYINKEKCIIELKEDYGKNFKIDPTLIDGGLLTGFLLTGMTNSYTYLPSVIEEIEINIDKQPRWVLSEVLIMDVDTVILNVEYYDEDFNKVISLKNYCAKNVSTYKNNNLRFKLDYENLSITDSDIIVSENSIYGKLNFSLDIPIVQDISESKETLIYSESIDNKDLDILRVDCLKIEDNENINRVYFLLGHDHDGLIQGFIRSFINESKKEIHLIILSDSNEMNQIQISSILSNVYGSESEYYIQDGNVNALKLVKNDLEPQNSDMFYLNVEQKGNFNSLGFFPIYSEVIPQQEMLIQVKASALNFKDVMVSLGVVDEDYIGYEVSGIVINPGNSSFKEGDEVIASPNKTGKGISNYVYCDQKYVWKKPNNLSFIQAAAIGLIFGTTYVCLMDRAKIKKGDVVLIHSATGGIGQSAIQFCNMMGATIIATAGNDEKRNKLRNEYNIKYISNSRNPDDFKRDVLKFTDGKGVDVILNSLAGKSLLTNLEILKEGGIMVEIGKRDILENNSITIGKFIDSITYSAVHFDRLMESNPDYIRSVMTNVINLFETEKLKPIEIEEHHISEAVSMIKYMSKGLHTGKIVLNVDDWKPDEFKPAECIFSPSKYYLISGGLGGLGVELVYWMQKYGANNFILMSRSGRKNQKANRLLNILEKKGCNIEIAKIDICDFNGLDRYLSENNFKIDGVFHLAGLIKDKMISKMTKQDIEDVIKPKVEGCNILHQVTLQMKLRFFVTFSSISALVGNPSQANYAAANCYLDRFCYQRRKLGLPGLSVNVGAVGGTGMIQNDYILAKSMMSNGFSFIHYHQLFENISKELFNTNISQICVSNQNWNKMVNLMPKSNLISHLVTKNKVSNISNGNDNLESIKEKIISHVKELLEIENIENNVNLVDYGIDSIMAMELSSWCEESLNINIPQLDLLQGVSVNDIVSNYMTEDNVILDSSESSGNSEDNKDNIIKLQNHIKELLELDESINLDKNLLDYGIDSIMAMELANWCSDELNISVNQVDILQGITINKIFSNNGSSNSESSSNSKNIKNSNIKVYKKIRDVKLKPKKIKIQKIELDNNLKSETSYNMIYLIICVIVIVLSYFFVF